MQVINLISDVQLEERKGQRKNTLILFSFGLITVVLLFIISALFGFAVIQNGIKDKLKSNIADAKKEITSNHNRFDVEVTDPRTGITRKVHIEEAGRLVKGEFTAISTLLNGRLSWKLFLFNISEVTPSTVAYTNFNVNPDLTISLLGNAKDLESVGVLINSLKTYHGDLVTLGLKNGVLTKEKDGSIVLVGSDKDGAKNVTIAKSADAVRLLLLLPTGAPVKKQIQDALKGKIEQEFLFSKVSPLSAKLNANNSYDFSIELTANKGLF